MGTEDIHNSVDMVCTAYLAASGDVRLRRPMTGCEQKITSGRRCPFPNYGALRERSTVDRDECLIAELCLFIYIVLTR